MPRWGEPEDKQCSVKGCESKVIAKGLCSKHYQATRYKKSKETIYCKSDNCYGKQYAKGFCRHHYNEDYRIKVIIRG